MMKHREGERLAQYHETGQMKRQGTGAHFLKFYFSNDFKLSTLGTFQIDSRQCILRT